MMEASKSIRNRLGDCAMRRSQQNSREMNRSKRMCEMNPNSLFILLLVGCLSGQLANSQANNSTTATTATTSASINMQDVYANMSSMLSAQGATGAAMMTNTSLTQSTMNGNQANRSSSLSSMMQQQQQAANSSSNPQQFSTKGSYQVKSSLSASSQRPTNSPATISRLRQNSPNRSGDESVMSMAADDMHETRASVSANVGLSIADAKPSSKQKAQSSDMTSTQMVQNAARPQEIQHLQPRTGAQTSQSAISTGTKGQQYVPSPRQLQSTWASSSSASSLSKPAQQRNPPSSAGNWQSVQMMDSMQHKFGGPFSQYSDPHSDPMTDPTIAQLERPSGYSYEPSTVSGDGGYTHTSSLSPARQEIQMIEQMAPSRQRQRQYQPHSAMSFEFAPRGIGSSSSSIQHLEQQATKGASQSPQFTGSTNSIDIPKHPSRLPPAATIGSPQTVMPPLHHHPTPITGTPLNPCKPPMPFIGQEQLSQSSIQVAGSSEFGNQGSGGQPKYARVGDGTRLRSQYIFKVLRADSLTDCELACSRASAVAGNNQQDTCRSFNYRAYFAAENCELSRWEIRNLKLEDSAQFEQHTQFDFYALESMNPPVGSPLMAGASSSLALSYSPFQEADCLDVSQSCSPDGMEFTLRTQEPFNGRIYTYGFYDSCFFDGESATTSVLRVSRPNGFPRCGTQQFGDMITNIIVVQFNDHVQTTRDKKYNLTCYFSGPGEAVVTSNYLDTKVDERSHPIQIEHLPPQNVITSNVHLRVLYRGQPTNTIAVGDLLTFRLETRSTHHRSEWLSTSGQNEIFATNVIARDPYSGRQIQLIDSRGCPVDPVNVFPELQRTPDGALESEFYAFKIPDSNFLIFQATVRTCKAPCEPVICQSTGGPGGSSDSPIRGQYVVQSTVGGLGGTKGGYLTQTPQAQVHLQPSSAPSWGRRRRRRNAIRDDNESSASDSLSVGETIEHIIPARLGSSSSAREDGGSERTREIKTFKRPDYSEAEEEVKEMFRVYMSRAEIDRRDQLRQQRNKRPAPSYSSANARQPDKNSTMNFQQDSSNPSMGEFSSLVQPDSNQKSHIDWDQSFPIEEASQLPICLNQVAYYVMLFTCVSLSLMLVSVLLVSLYVARRAKFHLNDSIADSLF